MPCRDDSGYSNSYHKDELDKRTDQLCTQLGYLEEVGLQHHIHGSLRPWWDAHKKQDAECKAEAKKIQDRKEAKEAALAKISKKDRELLGL